MILTCLIKNISEEVLPETLCGLRPGHSIAGIVFMVRHAQKCTKQNLDLYAVFIGLTKTFDIENRESLWTILATLGCPKKLIKLVRLFYNGVEGLILSNGDLIIIKALWNHRWRETVLCASICHSQSFFFMCVLNHAVHDLERGVYLKYRPDGFLFDLHRLSARTKTSERLLPKHHCRLKSHLQINPNRYVAQVCRQFGLM